jgi:hypothetical protein
MNLSRRDISDGYMSIAFILSFPDCAIWGKTPLLLVYKVWLEISSSLLRSSQNWMSTSLYIRVRCGGYRTWRLAEVQDMLLIDVIKKQKIYNGIYYKLKSEKQDKETLKIFIFYSSKSTLPKRYCNHIYKYIKKTRKLY